MKQLKKWIVAGFLCAFIPSLGCDICGCFMGVVPYDNQSSIAFMHRYRVFNGYRNYQSTSRYFPAGAYKTMHNDPHDSAVVVRNYSSADYESYKIFELRGKYFIHKRIELNAFASVVSNKSKEDDMKRSVTGIGDPSFFIGYHLVRPSEYGDFKHRCIVGAGIKIPSGNYYAKDHHNERLPFLMQPGTGSVDYFFYSTYVMAYKKVGFSTTLNYKINGTNFYKERIGNSITNFSSLFVRFKKNNWLFMPTINSYYEYTKGLYVFDKLTAGTQMNELMCGVGLEVFYKNIGLNMNVQKTVHQQTSENNLRSAGRVFATLSYNFNQRNYLLKNKVKPTE